MADANQALRFAQEQRPVSSLLHHSPAFILLVIAIADAGRLADSDLWNHLRTGQITLSTRHLIRYDPYSYTAFGHLWRNHEWLSQVALAASYNCLGVFGLKLLKLLCAAATISFLALGLAETAAPAHVQRAVLMAVAVALVPQMQFRPHLATFVLLSLVLALLARDTYRSPPRLWPLIPIFALWANLHGGCLAGLAAMATYTAVVAADELRRRQGWHRSARLATITVACAFAALANPDGIGIWDTVTRSATNPVIRAAISEWQPLLGRLGIQWHLFAPGVIVYLLPLALFAALAVAVFLTPSFDDAALVAIAALFVVGAFISARNMALAVIALSAPLARHAGVALGKRPAGVATSFAPTERMAEKEPGRVVADAGSRFNPLFASALAVALAAATGLFSNRMGTAQHYPVGAVAFMKKHNLHGNLLCDYNWGDYLIWHTAPASKVFIDGRCETVYPTRVIIDYLNFYFGLAGAERVLRGYPHDFVILPPDSKGYGVVAGNPDWKLLYRDPDAALFARSTSQAAGLAGVPVTGPAIPAFFP